MAEQQAEAQRVDPADALRRDGYAIFDPQIDEATLDGAIADLADQFRPEGGLARNLRRARRAVLGRHTTLSHRDGRRVQDGWTISPHVREIAFAPNVLAMLERAYGRRPRPFQTLNFRVGSEQRAHSDAMHFNSEPSGFMCGVWVALEDIGPDQGPLVYYRRSHELAELTMGDVAAEASDYPDYEEFVAALIEREGLEASHASLRKGEALIWSSNLLHGGAPQRDPSLTRWSQVTHYFFEGCRYWKPLDSTSDERRYWEPSWVR